MARFSRKHGMWGKTVTRNVDGSVTRKTYTPGFFGTTHVKETRSMSDEELRKQQNEDARIRNLKKLREANVEIPDYVNLMDAASVNSYYGTYKRKLKAEQLDTKAANKKAKSDRALTKEESLRTKFKQDGKARFWYRFATVLVFIYTIHLCVIIVGIPVVKWAVSRTKLLNETKGIYKANK
jgi:hypothetical protein